MISQQLGCWTRSPEQAEGLSLGAWCRSGMLNGSRSVPGSFGPNSGQNQIEISGVKHPQLRATSILNLGPQESHRLKISNDLTVKSHRNGRKWVPMTRGGRFKHPGGADGE